MERDKSVTKRTKQPYASKPRGKNNKAPTTLNLSTALEPVDVKGVAVTKLGDHPELKHQLTETACDLLSNGMTLQQVADTIGISRSALAIIRRKYPDFAEELDRASFDGAMFILEEIRQTPDLVDCPQRARVKIDALCRYLELRWPHRFGKRLEIEVKHLDMGSALAAAEQRAAKVIESVAYEVLTTDSESVVDPEIEDSEA